MSTYAIGDLQGCLEPLQRLLDKIEFDPARDRLWLAGDLINRGPDSLECLRFVYSLRKSLEVVLGNHDLHLLAVARGHRNPNPKDTLAPIIEAPDREALLDWLRCRSLMHYDAYLDYVMVHAGIPPQWDLERARAHAREVEAVLQSDQLDEFLAQMYGNEPNRWKNKLYGPARWRVITNYFTRMRFCTAEGELDLESKGGADTQRPGFAPWYAHANHRCRNHRILFGHWAALEGEAGAGNVYPLDTGCVWGGSLTALCLEDQQVFRCACS